MDDLTAWLEAAGLAQHAAVLADNGIDLAILRDLTESDMREMGFGIADRKRLLRAADRLPARAPRAERRQLTVLFCDIVGSTELSRELDPEELRRVLQTYYDVCTEAVEHYGGHVAQYLGDGVLVYFGYPRAHEDDARRAMLAALRLRSAVAAIDGRHIRVRVGMHTGLTVVGEIGGGGRRTPLAVGDAPNIAARIEALAQPGQILASEATHRLAGRWFRTRTAGERALRGVDEVAALFEIVDALPAAGDDAIDRVPVIGRDRELGALASHWADVVRGAARTVRVTGDAGIGKSALVRAFLLDAAPSAASSATFACSAYETGKPLAPFARSQQPSHTLTVDAARLQLFGPSDAPRIVVVEDIHWADASTLRLLASIEEEGERRALLLILTTRPDAEVLSPRGARSETIAVGPLDDASAAAVISALDRDARLPPPVVTRICGHADGVPLYLEHLTRFALDAGQTVNETGWRDTSTFVLPELLIPATLRDSLTATLDALGAAKRVAQVAAVIGDDIRRDVLEEVLDDVHGSSGDALEALAESAVLVPEDGPDGVRYAFTHALLRDAAYETLLKTDREALHGAAVDAYRRLFGDADRREPARLAHHCERAGRSSEAFELWTRAGRDALRDGADTEALGHFTAAHDLLDALRTEDRGALELDLAIVLLITINRTDAYHRRGAWTADAVSGLIERIERLGGEQGDAVAVAASLWHRACDERYAYGSTEQALRYAAAIGDLRGADANVLRLQALHARWHALSHGSGALEDLRRGVELADEVGVHRHHLAFGSHDTRACARANLAYALAHDARFDEAVEAVDDALAYAARLGDPYSTTYVLALSAFTCEIAGDLDRWGRIVERGLRTADYYCFQARQMFAYQEGWLAVRGRRVAEGREIVEREYARVRKGIPTSACDQTYYLASTLMLDGDASGALAAIDACIARGFTTVEYYRSPEIHRLRGELEYARSGDRASAQASLDEAIRLARLQHAPVWEQRAVQSAAAIGLAEKAAI